eukprot:203422-Amorphochlora_amoeboformis.AAC.1
MFQLVQRLPTCTEALSNYMKICYYIFDYLYLVYADSSRDVLHRLVRFRKLQKVLIPTSHHPAAYMPSARIHAANLAKNLFSSSPEPTASPDEGKSSYCLSELDEDYGIFHLNT